MKTLYLLRHAKSSWADASLEDFDRPLNARGLQDGMAVAEWCATSGVTPQLVLCSPATRTRETCSLVLPYLDPAPQLRVVKELYLAEAEMLLNVVRRTGGSANRLMVIGHNDGLHDFAMAMLDRSGAESGEMRRLRAKYPTAALCEITLPIREWSELDVGLGRLERYVVPADIAVAA